MFGMSCVDMPDQSVAQNTKLCSLAIDLMFPAVISEALPSSPCPYSDALRLHAPAARPPRRAGSGR